MGAGKRSIIHRGRSAFIRLLSHLPVSDRFYIQARYWLAFGRRPDLVRPQRFTEKIQWLKLHGYKPGYTRLVDKFAARSYFEQVAGESYLVPLIGVYERAEDIPFQALPQKFMLKTTHGSGWNIRCNSKDRLDMPRSRRQLNAWLTQNYYAVGREPVYKDIPPRILCEEMLPSPPGGLADYKIFCFSARARLIQVDLNRFTHHSRSFYDRDWQRLPFEFAYPAGTEEIPAPSGLGEMVTLAERLAGEIPFIRVDFYQVGEKIYIGEMCFYPDNGFYRFQPDEWDQKIGDMLNCLGPSQTEPK